MHRKSTRREFLRRSSLAGAGYWFAGGTSGWAKSKSPGEVIRFACIAVGGKGRSDSEDAQAHGDVVAICDIDEKRLDHAADKFPRARKYRDYRKMLGEMEKSIDAVTVSTPDHSHAPAATMAMKMSKHCCCQKPLTHSVYEARRIGEIARQMNVTTQMGNQGTANHELRKAATCVRQGVIGAVRQP